MPTFLIEARKPAGITNPAQPDIWVPAQDYGHTVMDIVDYYQWRYPKTEVKAKLCPGYERTAEELTDNNVPVGSVLFCQSWYAQNSCKKLPPLAIPENLRKFIKREWLVSDTLPNDGENWFVKDLDMIKSPLDRVEKGTGKKYPYPMLMSRYVTDIASEWRIFVSYGEIVDIRCYEYGIWPVVPDMRYCKSIVNEYMLERSAYTLDVMVRKNGETDILEMHDFFACGLYGFDDPRILVMLKAAQRNILSLYQEKINNKI